MLTIKNYSHRRDSYYSIMRTNQEGCSNRRGSTVRIVNIHDHLPVYSGKQIVSGDLRIFSSNKSFLFRKRMIEVSPNHLLLQIESNNLRLSCIRFWKKKKKEIRFFVMLYFGTYVLQFPILSPYCSQTVALELDYVQCRTYYVP